MPWTGAGHFLRRDCIGQRTLYWREWQRMGLFVSVRLILDGDYGVLGF